MPVSPKRRRAPAPSAGRTRTAATRSLTEQVGDLAWAGQHAAAIALATRSLDGASLPADERLALLDLRSESYLAHGDFAPAQADSATMLELARSSRKAGHVALAGCRDAMVLMRTGRSQDALKPAEAALAAARRAKDSSLEALALLRLAEAQFRVRTLSAESVRNSVRAARIYAELGDLSGRARALWAEAAAHNNL